MYALIFKYKITLLSVNLCNIFRNMTHSYEHNLNELIIYQKSLYIFKLARHIASYITDNKSMLTMYASSSETDKYADNLVMNALGLVPKIVEAENQKNPQLKLKYAKSLRKFIDGIYHNCVKLEHSKINGSDFVKLLRIELKNMRKIHKLYVRSLLK